MREMTGHNKYRNLLSNTLIFGISTFGSKIMTLLMQPIYTRVLDPEVNSTAGLIMTTSNFLLPFMHLCMAEAIIRFAMEKSYRRDDVFSISFYTVLVCYGVLWLFYPLLSRIDKLDGYLWLVMLYCLTSALRAIVTNFTRATGLVRIFALDGIFTTLTTVVFNLVFLLGFKLGAGYILGTVCADALSALTLFFGLKMYRFLKLRGIDRMTVWDMFRYALPLVPTAIFWWVTNLSDKYFVAYMVSDEVNGVYDKASTIPNLIIQVSTFFTRAWELSAFTEYKGPEGEKFFSNVFRSYYTFVFLVAAGLILMIKPLTALLMNGPDSPYYTAWQYSLFLILGVSFSCLVTFLGAVYNAVRQNLMVTFTTFIGAAVNIGLNFLLIPQFGAVGAAFATFISFFTVFLIRAVDTRRFIRIQMQPMRLALNLVLLLAQILVGLNEVRFWVLWELFIIVLLVLCNLRQILFILKHMLKLLAKRRRRA